MKVIMTIVVATLVVLGVWGLVSCKRDPAKPATTASTVEQAEAAIDLAAQKTGNALKTAAEKTTEAATAAGEATKEATSHVGEKTGKALESAGESLEETGEGMQK